MNASPVWTIGFYIEPRYPLALDLFKLALSVRLGEDPYAVEDWLSPSRIRDMLSSTQHIKLLRAAYRDVRIDVNRTSMLALSEPLRADYAENIMFESGVSSRDDRVTWLLTGDARFDSASKVGELKAHFRPWLSGLSVVALPHHGAEPDFHSDLLSLGDDAPRFAFASAQLSHGSWRHPSSNVVKAVVSAGTFPWVVTEKPTTTLRAFSWPVQRR